MLQLPPVQVWLQVSLPPQLSAQLDRQCWLHMLVGSQRVLQAPVVQSTWQVASRPQVVSQAPLQSRLQVDEAAQSTAHDPHAHSKSQRAPGPHRKEQAPVPHSVVHREPRPQRMSHPPMGQSSAQRWPGGQTQGLPGVHNRTAGVAVASSSARCADACPPSIGAPSVTRAPSGPSQPPPSHDAVSSAAQPSASNHLVIRPQSARRPHRRQIR